MAGPDRACGDCQACCVAIRTWDEPMGLLKPSGERCPYQCDSGCSIYATRPRSCAAYSCRWLEGWGATRDRPDKLGLIVEREPEGIKPCWIITECVRGAADARRAQSVIEGLASDRPVLLCRFKAHGDDPGAGLEFYGSEQDLTVFILEAAQLLQRGSESGCLSPRREDETPD